MIGRDAICAEARTWLETPYQHQAHVRGHGCDCGGLIGGVAVALGLLPTDWWETAFAPLAGYARQPSAGSLLHVLDAFMPRIEPETAQPGDVLVIRFRAEPQHVGFLVPYVHGGAALLHALNANAARKVVEHRLDERWRSRVTHAYTLPGIG